MILYLGTYTDGGTSMPGSCGQGIMRCEFDTFTGKFSGLQTAAEVLNPSWLELTDDEQILFAVSERLDGEGQVHAYEVGENGSLRHHVSRSSHGVSTCHLTTTRERVFAASYSSGCLSEHVRAGLDISDAHNVLKYSGSGPNEKRQEQAHAHQSSVSPDGKWLYVCDLGSDCIRMHRLGGEQLEPTTAIALNPGSGPRHLIFHPSKPLAWVVCELTPQVVTLSWDAKTGLLEPTHQLQLTGIPGLEDVGAAAAIRLHPTEKLLGVSERASSSICLFGVEDGGRLVFLQRISGRGEGPRDFIFTPNGGWLLTAYQNSHQVESHAIDVEAHIDEKPSDTLAVNSPVSLVPLGGYTIIEN